jgi:hypothetical protein
MIAFLPMWILGAPLVLALIDLMATRSGGHDDADYGTPTGRYVGTRTELRRGEESSPVVGQPTNRFDVPANVS